MQFTESVVEDAGPIVAGRSSAGLLIRRSRVRALVGEPVTIEGGHHGWAVQFCLRDRLCEHRVAPADPELAALQPDLANQRLQIPLGEAFVGEKFVT